MAQNPDDPAAEYGDGLQTGEGIGVGSTVAGLQATDGTETALVATVNAGQRCGE